MTSAREAFPYASAAAFRAAFRDRLSVLARAGGQGLDELQRQFAYDTAELRRGIRVASPPDPVHEGDGPDVLPIRRGTTRMGYPTFTLDVRSG